VLILARPHTSLLDGPAVAFYMLRCGIRHAVFAVDPDYARHPVWSKILKAIGWITGGHTMLPLDSSRPYAMRTLARLLDEGRDVVIFPQGTGLADPDRPDAKGVDWLLNRLKLREGDVKTVTLIHGGWFPRVTDEGTPSSPPRLLWLFVDSESLRVSDRFRRYLNNEEKRYG